MKNLLALLLLVPAIALAQTAGVYNSKAIPTPLADPVPVANGGSGIASTTAYSVVLTGTTATGAWKVDLGPGTAGQALTAGGAGAYPVWGTPGFGFGGTGLTSAADDTVMVSSGSAWVASAIPNCTDTAGNHLNYTASTNAFSCGTSASAPTAPGSGRVVLTSGDITTSSTSLVDLTGATLTFTTGANPVLCGFSGTASGTLTQSTYINLNVDGALQLGTSGLEIDPGVSGARESASFTYMTAALSAASHTIKVQWRVSGSSATMTASSTAAATFWCHEVK